MQRTRLTKGKEDKMEQKRTPDPMKVFGAIAWIMSQRDDRQVRLTRVRKVNDKEEKKRLAG